MDEPIAAPETPPPAAPAPAPPPEGKVAIRDLDGSVSLIARADLPRAVQEEGARPATEEEYYSAKAGKVGEAASAAIGLGRGATFGLSDPALIEASRLIGGDAEAEDTRQALDLARRVNPKATFGGEIVGSLAPLLATGGAGAAGEAAEGGSLLARAAGAAPRLLGEGALMGGGGQLSEDALGGHATTAEKLVSSAFGGAVFNLLLGGALHAGGGFASDALGKLAGGAEKELTRGLSTYGARDVDALAERTFGATEPGVGEKIRRALGDVDSEKVRQKLVQASAALSGRDAGTIEHLSRLDAEGRELRRVAVFDSEKEIEAAQGELRKSGDDFLRATPSVTDEFRGAMKAEKIAGLVKEGNEAQVATYARKQIAATIESVENELRHADGVAPQTVKSLESIARSAYHADASIAEAIERGENVNARSFIALDSLKRDVQGLTDGGYRRVAAMTDPFEARLARRTVDTMDRTQQGLRASLENTDLFGKAAQVQAAINAEWTKQIEASRRFGQALTTDVGRSAENPFLRQRGIDPAKLDTYTRGLLNPNADLTHGAVKDYVESTERLAKTIRENVSLPPEKLAQVARIEKAAATFRSTVEKTEKTLTAVNQYKAITGANADSVAGLASTLGFAAGGPIGGIIGTAIGGLSNPGKTIAQLAAIERMSGKLDGKIGASVRSFLGIGEKSAAVAEGASRKVTADEVRQLRELVANPAAVQARAAAASAPFQESAPRVAQAMSTTIVRAANHLRQNLPAEPMPIGPTFTRPPPRKLSDAQLAKAQKTVESVNSLDSVLHGIANGRLNREHVMGLKEVYPTLYDAMRSQLREDAEKLRPTMTIQQQVALSVLFDEPLNAMMRPENIRAFQKTFASGPGPDQTGNQPAAPNPPKRPLATAGGTRSTAWDEGSDGRT